MSMQVNRIELAKRVLQEQQNLRDDIVGAWIGGSTARGEDTESSDVDLIILVSGPVEADGQWVDTWLDDVYIEAAIFPFTEDESPEDLLRNAYSATHMNHAHILYDPTDFLTQRQEAVRAAYMDPQWLGIRLQFWLDIARQQVQALQMGLSQHDPLTVCYHAGYAMLAFISVPLLRAGLSPSSSRGLMQLASISKELHDRIAEFEGSRAMSVQEVSAMEPLFLEWAHLTASNTRKNATKYVAKKAVWLVHRGLPESALHALWVYVHYAIGDLMKHKEKEESARVLAQRWLEAVKWDNEAVLQQKGAVAQRLLEELAVLAADLPG